MNYKEYKESVKLLNSWAYAYYSKDAPKVPDVEYDKLYHEVLKFEENNSTLVDYSSPTLRVGAQILEGFNKASHIEKMWSMEDVFDKKDLVSWTQRVEKTKTDFTFYCEPKFDGASLNLIYENGLLKQAITRGDGSIGEDVTLNAKTIKSIPIQISHEERIEIRGEILIRKDDFQLLNDERAKRGEALFANPRNAAAGSLRQLNSSITASRKLVFYPWGIGKNSLKMNYLSEKMTYIYSLGFLKPMMRVVTKNVEEVYDLYYNFISKREEIPLIMDGMVVKVDEISLQEELGYTVKYPKWMVAFKFPALEQSTQILGITLQVGRTGVITPVAEVCAVDIDGVIVERATLHNFDEIRRKDIRVGDFVTIIRSGDVIPKIIHVQESRRKGCEKVYIKPTNCPVCNKELLDDGALLKCQNLVCDARVEASLIFFASKQALNIDGLGKKIVKTLYQKGQIKSVLDIFFLTKEALLTLEGFKDKKADNLLNSIQMVKGSELWRFINALGIEHIGEVASKKLSEIYGLEFVNISHLTKLNIDGFGVEMEASLIEFLHVNKDLIEKLIEVIAPKTPKAKEIIENFLNGKSVVLTGSMSKSRDLIKNELEELGAKIVSSVSKKTDFVVYGDDAGSKYEKAKLLGVTLLSEKEFYEILNK